MLGPGIQVVDAGAADQVVVAAPAEQDVVGEGRRRLLAGRGISPQAVVAREAVHRVAAAAAVEAVASRGAVQDVVARAAVDDADEIFAALVQIADVQRQDVDRRERALVGHVGIRHEADVVVAHQSGNAELLDQRRAQRIERRERIEVILRRSGIGDVGAPRREDFPRLDGAGERIHRREIDMDAAVGELADEDGVVLVGALDEHDVGRVIEPQVAAEFVAVIAVERVERRLEQVDRRQRIGLADIVRREILAARIEHHDVDVGAAVER
ncbi:MAG TPA: hypothetical protein VIH00_12315, partial [Candidatus Limnocylindrales bacterium]